jgi:histidyl-tRNA synthetase
MFSKKLLDIAGVEYAIDSGIVRGLDYYSGTVFEAVLKSDE